MTPCSRRCCRAWEESAGSRSNCWAARSMISAVVNSPVQQVRMASAAALRVMSLPESGW